MDRGAWKAAVHRVAEGRTRLSVSKCLKKGLVSPLTKRQFRALVLEKHRVSLHQGSALSLCSSQELGIQLLGNSI